MKRVLHVLGPSEGGIRRHVRYVAEHPPPGYETVGVAGPSGSADYFHDLPFTPWHMRRLRHMRSVAGVFHAHGLTAAQRALRAGLRPLVVTLHVYAPAGARAGPARAALRALAPAVARRAHAVIAVSAEIALRVPAALVIPPAVGLSGPPSRSRGSVRCEMGTPAASPVVLAVARLHPDKALDVLIRAMSHAPVAAEAWIAGDGPCRARLEREAARAPVRFLGYRIDVADLLGAADVFALPSLGEGYPIAVVDAVTAGLPVVATRVGAVPEIVGDAGMLVPPRDGDAFAGALRTVLTDEALRSALAAKARSVRLPTADELVARVGEVYDEVTR